MRADKIVKNFPRKLHKHVVYTRKISYTPANCCCKYFLESPYKMEIIHYENWLLRSRRTEIIIEPPLSPDVREP